MLRILLLILLYPSLLLAQTGEIILITGKTKSFKSIDGSGEKIAYRAIETNKLKTIDFERVFSILYADSTEKIIYVRDENDSTDFSISQMRSFILGEQEAIKSYNNNTNKVVSFLIGSGASFISFYGLIPPPLYATIVGSISPKIEKQKISNPAMINVQEFREGYERKGREFKTRQGMMWAMIGLATGLIVQSLILK